MIFASNIVIEAIVVIIHPQQIKRPDIWSFHFGFESKLSFQFNILINLVNEPKKLEISKGSHNVRSIKESSLSMRKSPTFTINQTCPWVFNLT